MEVVEKLLSQELGRTFFGIAVYQYLLALVFILLGFTTRRLADKGLARLAKVAKKTDNRFDDILIEIVRKPLPLAFVAVGIYLALNSLPVPTEPIDIRQFMHALFRSLTVLFVVWVSIRVIDRLCEEWYRVVEGDKSRFDENLIPIIRKTGKAFLGVIGGILFLQNMGYSVGSLLAGFGLGGAAVALASKDSLSNLFGSIVVFFDQPFRVGDWIEMDGLHGTVEEIGLRTTRIRTFANSLMSIPNAKFTTSIVNNWSRMRKRRIKMTIGLTYDTSAEQMEKAVEAIRRIIRESKDMRDDFSLVNFDGFGESSLNIFIYCFTKTTNWSEFLDAKQRFMLEVMRAVKGLGLSFAFPTRTLHVAGSVAVSNGSSDGGKGALV